MEPYEQQQQQKQKPFHSCGHHRRSSSNKMLKSNHRFEMPNYHHDHHQNDEYGRRKLPIFSYYHYHHHHHHIIVSANSIVGVHVEHFPNTATANSKLSNSNPLGNHNINIGKAVFDQRSNEIPSSSAAGTPAVSIKPDLFGLITEVNVECNSNAIHIALIAPHLFNGMIYPKGLSKNSSCMHEYYDVNEFNYTLPLRACNTMSMDVVSVVLMVLSQEGKTETTPLYGTAPVPTSSMKIYHQGTQKEIIADNVKIGDRLTLTIAIEQQDIYGMKITNCLVRDGLNWGEQPLINDEGCPVDKEIMGPFDYSLNLTRASVSFHAHKFPYTSSVYYQCNVRLCLKDEIDGCTDVPPSCDQNGRNYRHLPGHQRRQRRDTYDAVVIPDMNHQQYHRAMAQRMRNTKMDKDLSMEVYSGLYVDENENNTPELDDEESETSMNGDNDQDRRHGRNHHNRHHDPNEFCISMRKFAIGVAIASLLLMLAVLLLVICILQRRRRRHHQQHQRFYSQSAAGSTIGSGSVYSGPYTNRGYIRD
ncbi:hypothetical protein DERF_010746 [Dermatophagoides farinae]|uniref:ZP domain-containing protein n=1 Tax=Dermatophagoides farinae TaxID=6954 RepID=A0A922HQW4_DERFA|nr:hypothetical protein DERF_010746 [Dermatophagoides farinae]